MVLCVLANVGPARYAGLVTRKRLLFGIARFVALFNSAMPRLTAGRRVDRRRSAREDGCKARTVPATVYWRLCRLPFVKRSLITSDGEGLWEADASEPGVRKPCLLIWTEGDSLRSGIERVMSGLHLTWSRPFRVQALACTGFAT